MMVDLRTSVSRFAPDSSTGLHEMRLSVLSDVPAAATSSRQQPVCAIRVRRGHRRGGTTDQRLALALDPGQDRASAGAELVWRIARQAVFSRVHQNSVPSVQMQCRMMAILRATATRAFLPPIRFAKRVPQAFNGENR